VKGIISLIWIGKRLLLLIPSVIGVTLVTFCLANAVPGDPVYALVGERTDEAVIEAYREKLGLEQGVALRYVKYMQMLLQGDMGQSYYTGRQVMSEIREKLPNTLYLACTSMALAVVMGLGLGCLAAYTRGSWLDRTILFFATSLISFPVFWFGMLLVLVFAIGLRWFPVGGMEHPLAIVLPALTLGSRSAGYLARLSRTKILDCLSEEYILTIRAKGGGPCKVLHHALRNAFIPILTFIGLDFGSYLNGSVLTETIFGWDGLGRYAIGGIFRRDYPVILGTVLFGALVFMLMNLLVDFLYAYFNPRLRHGGQS
jgi:ABC-type dipeptide/oligopeptide/nickel transport system permease component